MVRFLKKKIWKHSKPEPENAQANQTANIDAKRGKDVEGEYRPRRADKAKWV